jgi:hypothetical protein
MPNLNISFTPASPAPSLGYRVRYWNVNTPGSITTVSPNPSASPVIVTGVAEGCYAGTVESICSAGVFSSTVSFSACSPSPTYYYYTGILCGGSIQQSFRSTQSNLADSGLIVKALCSACGNTEQCFDNVSVTTTPNTNDVISTHVDCAACTGGGTGTVSILNNGGTGAVIDDFQPAWFFVNTGVIPVQNLGTADGGHSGFTGNFGVTVTGAMGGCLTLTVNGTMVQNLGISASGIYTFLNVNIPSNASVIISLDQGACQ